MIVANVSGWDPAMESQGWRVVDQKWLAFMERKVRESPLWKKSGDDIVHEKWGTANEWLGRIILWFQEVRDEAVAAETQDAA